MPVHAFVDETKANGLLVVAAVLEPRDLTSARATMRSVLLPRQTRVHFVKERHHRKRQILSLVAELPVDVLVYDATRIADPREARRACLVRLVADLAEVSAHRLVIERDESLLRSDRETLYRAVRQSGVEDLLVYEHLTPRVEPLLWIPDAVAWCWSKGGWWREGVDPLVRQIKTLR